MESSTKVQSTPDSTSEEVRTPRILQVGLAKSGNLWLYKILQNCLSQAGLSTQSFIQNQPIHDLAKGWDLSYEGQADIDVLDITDQGYFYRISSIFRHPVPDLDDYLRSTTHVWTHSSFCDASWNVLPKFDRVVYIVRDPRDAALSHARFMLTPYMNTYYPNDMDSKEEYLENRLEGKLRRWTRHVGPYLAHADDLDIHVVFYERLLLDFEDELSRLLDYLEISLTEQECRNIEEAVTFQSMKEEDPEHVQKGQAGKWLEQMTSAQKRRSEAVAGPLMKKLGYPLQDTTDEIRPSVPDQMTPEEADDMIEHAQYPFLKDKLMKGARQVYQAVFR